MVGARSRRSYRRHNTEECERAANGTEAKKLEGMSMNVYISSCKAESALSKSGQLLQTSAKHTLMMPGALSRRWVQ